MLTVQILYEWDFKKDKFEKITERMIAETAEKIDPDFITTLVKGVVENVGDIDKIIGETAPEWPVDQIAVIDKTVLRIGIYELLFSRDVPPKAVINEAVELGKEFGSESSGKFINGVLGTIYRNSDFYVEEEEEVSAGAVIFKEVDGKIKFVLILNPYNKWSFPKGRVEEGETWQETALREAKEETGLETLEIIDFLGEIKYSSTKEIVTENQETKQVPIKKTVYLYLVKTSDGKLSPSKSEGGILAAKWYDAKAAEAIIGYENAKDKLKIALEKIKKGGETIGP